jgi:hypothetical protein
LERFFSDPANSQHCLPVLPDQIECRNQLGISARRKILGHGRPTAAIDQDIDVLGKGLGPAWA